MSNSPYQLNTSANSYLASGYPSGARRIMLSGKGVVSDLSSDNPKTNYASGRTDPKKLLKEEKKMKRLRRRDRSYFFVMRKGVCFLMFVFLLLYVVGLALSYVNIEALEPYTSMYLTPDNTPYEVREEQEGYEIDEQGNYLYDEDGYVIYNEYQPKDVYYALSDSVNGFIAKITKKTIIGENGQSTSKFYDLVLKKFTQKAMSEASSNADEDDVTTEDVVTEREVSKTIGYYIVELAPLFIILGAVAAFIAMITSFFAMFGKRIFGGYWIASIIMLIGSAMLLLAGIATLSVVLDPNVFEVSGELDFSYLMSFLTERLSGPYYYLEDLQAADPQPLTFIANYTMLGVLAIPVIVFILSLFARKKVEYKVLNK